jgi:hypothetical protein
MHPLCVQAQVANYGVMRCPGEGANGLTAVRHAAAPCCNAKAEYQCVIGCVVGGVLVVQFQRRRVREATRDLVKVGGGGSTVNSDCSNMLAARVCAISTC